MSDSSSDRPGPRTRTRVISVDAGGGLIQRTDWLATEEPLEIRLGARGGTRSVAVTMRTPGSDFELAVGFLVGEGLLANRRDLRSVRYCVGMGDAEQQYNVVTVDLDTDTMPDLGSLERYGTISSACGVCGKTTLDALSEDGLRPIRSAVSLRPDVLVELPQRLRSAQPVFDRTGGLHAAALFDADGHLHALREDVGRHNALDKLVGWAFLDDRLPLRDGVVLVSGRASYELVLKCLRAGAATLCAISAPSSLAVALARRFGLTLVGFLRDGHGNVYAGQERVAGPAVVP